MSISNDSIMVNKNDILFARKSGFEVTDNCGLTLFHNLNIPLRLLI